MQWSSVSQTRWLPLSLSLSQLRPLPSTDLYWVYGFRQPLGAHKSVRIDLASVTPPSMTASPRMDADGGWLRSYYGGWEGTAVAHPSKVNLPYLTRSPSSHHCLPGCWEMFKDLRDLSVAPSWPLTALMHSSVVPSWTPKEIHCWSLPGSIQSHGHPTPISRLNNTVPY